MGCYRCERCGQQLRGHVCHRCGHDHFDDECVCNLCEQARIRSTLWSKVIQEVYKLLSFPAQMTTKNGAFPVEKQPKPTPWIRPRGSVSPAQGGCWYCNNVDISGTSLVSVREFDCNMHVDCAVHAWNNPEPGDFETELIVNELTHFGHITTAMLKSHPKKRRH